MPESRGSDDDVEEGRFAMKRQLGVDRRVFRQEIMRFGSITFSRVLRVLRGE